MMWNVCACVHVCTCVCETAHPHQGPRWRVRPLWAVWPTLSLAPYGLCPQGLGVPPPGLHLAGAQASLPVLAALPGL